MTFTRVTLVVSMFVALDVGMLTEFIPEYISKSPPEQQLATLTGGNPSLQGNLNQTRNQQALSNFAMRAATVLAHADRNDYSIASNDASSLFTDLPKYVDQSGDQAAASQLSQVLEVCDRTVAGLAKADPGIRPLLLQVFLKNATRQFTSDAIEVARTGVLCPRLAKP
jgi:hypothetical protein